MALLGELRILQRAIVGFEIGAGVLPVTVEEQVIERAREVIVVCNVALGLADGIVLVDALQRLAHCISRLRHLRQPVGGRTLHQQRNDVIDRGAARHAEAAVHVEFAEIEVRVGSHLGRGKRRLDVQVHRHATAIAIFMDDAARVGHTKRSLRHERIECAIKKSIHLCTPLLHRLASTANGTPRCSTN